MTQRERILAIAVGGLAVVVSTFFIYWWISGSLGQRRGQIAALRQKLQVQERLVAQTKAATRAIAEAEKRSLPPEPNVAGSLYGDWLLDQVVAARLVDPKVALARQSVDRNFFTALSFTASGKGTLAQVVDLLYRFYSVDYQHRITRLSIVPLEEPKMLSFSMTVEALSLMGAPQADRLTPRPASRLALGSEQKYVDVILGRNLFGGPNSPPRLSGLGNQRADRGRPFEVTPQVSDRDAADKFTFKLAKSAAEQARIDASTGRFRWTPPTTGTFEFEIAVTDDGIPARSATEKLTITVGEPRPEDPPPRTLAFDEAKFTVLSAIVERSGTSQIWLHNRPRDRMVKLGVGDSFEIGSVRGVVRSIGSDSFVFDSAGKLHKLEIRMTLSQAEGMPQEADASSATPTSISPGQ
jgi:hypothetical protein